MTNLSPLNDSLSQTKSTAFGLSKDLAIPIIVKVCYLESTRDMKDSLASLSEKFEDPAVFNTLSRIYRFSDLFIKISIFDGKNNNLVTIPVQTTYKSFNNKRVWNQYLKMAINFNQVSIDSYLKIEVYEIVNTKPKLFGVGYLSLFNRKSSRLRKGSQKIPIFTDPTTENIEYENIPGLTDLEKNLIKYEDGEFNRLGWLDKLVLPNVSSLNEPNKDHDYYLYLELPNFELPIVYSDVTYHINTSIPTIHHEQAPIVDNLNSNIVINSIDIPMSKDPNMLKIYDPDFQTDSNVNNQNNINVPLDPIELKYHKLERHINNNTILDKELKPSPQLRDELVNILIKPSNIELNKTERNLIWKFRYYFSKNNSINEASGKTTTTKSFLLKFIKSIDWADDYEVEHAFNEIIPNYWSVDKLQIGDALELLGSYFNPYILGKSVLASSSTPPTSNDSLDRKLKNEPSKFYKIFKNVTFLRKMAVDRLRLASSDELLLYLLQLVQALKYESLIYDKKTPYIQDTEHFEMANELNDDNDLLKSPLAKFLIEKSIENPNLGNFFYWYVKVENEDQLNSPTNPHSNPIRIYAIILNKYIDSLKKYSQAKKLPNYKNLKMQIWFIKKLTSLVELIRTTFRKNEATSKKIEFLREYLANPSNELLKFPEPFPLPLDPSVKICGCYPDESSVFKSSLSPLKITFKTIQKTHATSQLFGKKKNHKYDKYPLMFKIGDDLRQDQLVIQIINLMNQLLKNENLDLRLTPYKILATSPVAGLIQFVPNETLDSILAKTYPVPETNDNSSPPQPSASNNGILNYLRLHSQEQQPIEPEVTSVLNSSEQLEEHPIQPQPTVILDLAVSPTLMDNYVKSCAGYCVITYLLGVGDRHLDNLLLSPNGKFWHADFGYILGRDPKILPPLMKLPIQVIDGMGGLNHENFNIFKSYCFITYTTLRKNSNLILNLFQLMLDANIPDIMIDPQRAVEKVQEKFCLEMSEEEAILHFQNLINGSVNAFFPVVIDRLHSLAQYWRA